MAIANSQIIVVHQACTSGLIFLHLPCEVVRISLRLCSTLRSIFTLLYCDHLLFTMRALTEPELRSVLEKLTIYVGSAVKELLTNDSSKSDRWVFRLSGNRVHYVALSLANLATAIPRDNLLACGICLGRSLMPFQFRFRTCEG